MKRKLLLWIACLSGMSAVAQQDPVLMRINGKDIPRSEFEYACQKRKSPGGTEAKALSEYADSFVNVKLKVAAAEAAGMDTTLSFREELAAYRARLVQLYLTDQAVDEVYLRQVYDKLKANSRGEVQVMQLFKSLPQTVSSVRLHQAEVQMDSLYAVLKKNPQTNFSALVERYSDDRKRSWIGWLQRPEEFETIVFSLQKGEISKPFYTPEGLHIVKLLDRKEMPSFAEMRNEIERRLTARADYTDSRRAEALQKKLKHEYSYTPHAPGIEELLASGTTHKSLFTLDGRAYTGSDFNRFAASYPRAVKAQLEAFTTKTILDYGSEHLEQKTPAFRLQMQQHRDEMLLSAISEREVHRRAMTDEAGLAAYFKAHQSDYHWDLPRYNGAVLHCADKKTAKAAKKLVRKLSQSEWADAIQKAFNIRSAEAVKIEQGVFAVGDNKYVDKLVFKVGQFEPLKSYPFTVAIGEKQKGPDSYKEVGKQLAADYQHSLESLWLKRLRVAGKVEINQEVLKTVNNH